LSFKLLNTIIDVGNGEEGADELDEVE